MDEFKDKSILITGGTGSFGNAVLAGLRASNIGEVRIYSRDEKKQDDMRKQYEDPRLKFFIGDVRNYRSLVDATRGVDYVFHAAALKQVPSTEFHPMEAVNTNILGTNNLLDACIQNGVKRVVCLSTDKAVYPVNAMGISKAMMEKVMIAKSRSLNDSGTVVCATRYGNVMGSRGSVIPLFMDQIRAKQPLTVTDPNMTRFMMGLNDAVDLVLFAFNNARNGDIFVQKAPGARLGILVDALKDLLETEVPVNVIGTRHGEKLHETLLSREEVVGAEEFQSYFRIPADQRTLDYSVFVETGEESISHADDYNSSNTEQLDVETLKRLLLDQDFFQATVNRT